MSSPAVVDWHGQDSVNHSHHSHSHPHSPHSHLASSSSSRGTRHLCLSRSAQENQIDNETCRESHVLRHSRDRCRSRMRVKDFVVASSAVSSFLFLRGPTHVQPTRVVIDIYIYIYIYTDAIEESTYLCVELDGLTEFIRSSLWLLLFWIELMLWRW
jgi:hypothetical protein